MGWKRSKEKKDLVRDKKKKKGVNPVRARKEKNRKIFSLQKSGKEKIFEPKKESPSNRKGEKRALLPTVCGKKRKKTRKGGKKEIADRKNRPPQKKGKARSWIGKKRGKRPKLGKGL